MIGDNLLRFQNFNSLVWDAETESLGLTPNSNKIWQLGWILFEGKKETLSREDWLKQDNLDISKDAARITNFSWEEYNRRKVDLEPCFSEFSSYLYNPEYLNIGQNIFNFDHYLVNITRLQLGLKPDFSFIRRSICIRNLHLSLVLDVKPPKIGTSEWVAFNYKMSGFKKRGVKSNLKYLCGVYEVEYDETKHHSSANFDVSITKAIFDKLLWKIELEAV